MSGSVSGIDMSTIAELTLRWARHSLKHFNKWELQELHNEAFLVAVKLLDKGRFKPGKASLNTYLWHALPQDVRHRYRRLNGERILTNSEGKKKYQKREHIIEFPEYTKEVKSNGSLLVIGPSNFNEWLHAKQHGITHSLINTLNNCTTTEAQIREVDKIYANKRTTKGSKR